MIAEERIRRLREIETQLLQEECRCELGLCPSCTAIESIREERDRLEHPSVVA